MKRRAFSDAASVAGQCLCGAVRFEIDFPAFWAWHDHSRASRLVHGAAYATYVGTWRKRIRITAGEDEIARYEDKPAGIRAAASARQDAFPRVHGNRRHRGVAAGDEGGNDRFESALCAVRPPCRWSQKCDRQMRTQRGLCALKRTNRSSSSAIRRDWKSSSTDARSSTTAKLCHPASRT